MGQCFSVVMSKLVVSKVYPYISFVKVIKTCFFWMCVECIKNKRYCLFSLLKKKQTTATIKQIQYKAWLEQQNMSMRHSVTIISGNPRVEYNNVLEFCIRVIDISAASISSHSWLHQCWGRFKWKDESKWFYYGVPLWLSW